MRIFKLITYDWPGGNVARGSARAYWCMMFINKLRRSEPRWPDCWIAAMKIKLINGAMKFSCKHRDELNQQLQYKCTEYTNIMLFRINTAVLFLLLLWTSRKTWEWVIFPSNSRSILKWNQRQTLYCKIYRTANR